MVHDKQVTSCETLQMLNISSHLIFINFILPLLCQSGRYPLSCAPNYRFKGRGRREGERKEDTNNNSHIISTSCPPPNVVPTTHPKGTSTITPVNIQQRLLHYKYNLITYWNTCSFVRTSPLRSRQLLVKVCRSGSKLGVVVWSQNEVGFLLHIDKRMWV